MIAQSSNGSVEFDGKTVLIKTRMGTKTVPLNRVQAVEFKKAGMVAGWLRIDVTGSVQDVRAGSMRTQQMQQDPAAVLFSRASKNREFEAVADEINRALAEQPV